MLFQASCIGLLFKGNKAKWFAKQLASLVYQYKAKVLEFPSKKSDAFGETIQNYSKSPVCCDKDKLAKTFHKIVVPFGCIHPKLF